MKEPEFSAQPIAPAEVPAAPPGSLTPDLVSNIKVHNQGSQPAASGEDGDMDKIMQDVGKQMKKADNQPVKRHFFSKKTKPKKTPSAHQLPAAHTAAKAAPAKPPPKKSAPVVVITLTILVTAALIAVAVSAYKK
jgi:hypothetical protein